MKKTEAEAYLCIIKYMLPLNSGYISLSADVHKMLSIISIWQ